MPGPFTVTGALAGVTAAAGPFEYNGGLYVIAFSALGATSADRSRIGIFESLDDGATWSTLDEKEIGSGDETGLLDGTNYISTCADINFLTDPYLYTLYAADDAGLYVARANLATGAWDTFSARGPDLAIAGGFDGHPAPDWFIEQSEDGWFGIIADLLRDNPGGGQDRVSILTLSEDLATWSARTEPAQSAARSYQAGGIARGTSGRVHTLVYSVNDGDPDDVLVHHLLLDPSLGGSINDVATGTSLFSAKPNAGAAHGSTIAFLYNSQVVGPFTVGYNLAVLSAESAASPSFTSHDLVEAELAAPFQYAGAIGGNIDALTAAGGETGSQNSWDYDGGAWTETGADLSSVPLVVDCRRIAAGFAILFLADPDDSAELSLLLIGATAGTVLSGETIKTGESFFRTHGVTGGGPPVSCPGSITIVPPEPGCNGNPGSPVDPGERNACNVGAGFSF